MRRGLLQRSAELAAGGCGRASVRRGDHVQRPTIMPPRSWPHARGAGGDDQSGRLVSDIDIAGRAHAAFPKRSACGIIPGGNFTLGNARSWAYPGEAKYGWTRAAAGPEGLKKLVGAGRQGLWAARLPGQQHHPTNGYYPGLAALLLANCGSSWKRRCGAALRLYQSFRRDRHSLSSRAARGRTSAASARACARPSRRRSGTPGTGEIAI